MDLSKDTLRNDIQTHAHIYLFVCVCVWRVGVCACVARGCVFVCAGVCSFVHTLSDLTVTVIRFNSVFSTHCP